VEITVWHGDTAVAERACDGAFAAVAGIEALMSYHNPDSELSRLNGAQPGEPVDVSPHTWWVLSQAACVHRASEGLFDCAVAPHLEQAGFLPAVTSPLETGATQADVLLPAPGRVVKRRPVRLDLGGIAKGYAVDRAVAALRAAGVPAGCVNAGGDLRVFGPRTLRIDVRDPVRPDRAGAAVELNEAALATSAGYFSERTDTTGSPLTPIVDPRTHRCIDLRSSVTVSAGECIIADALTKVVALSADTRHPALERFRARAWILTVAAAAARH